MNTKNMDEMDEFLFKIWENVGDEEYNKIQWWSLLQDTDTYIKLKKIIEDPTATTAILYSQDENINVKRICKLRMKYRKLI